jgi:hypothetical protein
MGENDTLKVFKTTIELWNLDEVYLTTSNLKEFFFTGIGKVQCAILVWYHFTSFFAFFDR